MQAVALSSLETVGRKEGRKGNDFGQKWDGEAIFHDPKLCCGSRKKRLTKNTQPACVRAWRDAPVKKSGVNEREKER